MYLVQGEGRISFYNLVEDTDGEDYVEVNITEERFKEFCDMQRGYLELHAHLSDLYSLATAYKKEAALTRKAFKQSGFKVIKGGKIA